MCLTNVIIIIIIVLVVFWLFNTKPKEHFESGWNPLWVGRRAKDCYSLGPNDCLEYENCGICRTGQKLQCVPGDTFGPLFKEDCNQWAHSNYYDRHIFGERVTTVTPSWDQYAPEWETKYPSPVVRATL